MAGIQSSFWSFIFDATENQTSLVMPEKWLRNMAVEYLKATILILRRESFQNLSPEPDSSFLNCLSLWWFTTIQLLGARKALVIEDLFQLHEGTTAKYLHVKWEEKWNPAVEGLHWKIFTKYSSQTQFFKFTNFVLHLFNLNFVFKLMRLHWLCLRLS